MSLWPEKYLNGIPQYVQFILGVLAFFADSEMFIQKMASHFVMVLLDFRGTFCLNSS